MLGCSQSCFYEADKMAHLTQVKFLIKSNVG